MIGRLRVRVPAEAAGELSSPELTSCADSYSVSVPPPCCRSDPGHSAKCAGGILHLNTHTPLTQRSRSCLTLLSRKCGNLLRKKLTSKSSGNTRPQSSQLAEPLWTDPGLKSGLGMRELISTPTTHPPQKKKKKSAGGEPWNLPQCPRKRGKSHHLPHLTAPDHLSS